MLVARGFISNIIRGDVIMGKKIKVLFAVPYIYDDSFKEFRRNKTGFGIMVNSIFKQISSKNQAMLISHVLTKGHNNILEHSLFQILINIKFKDFIRAIKSVLNIESNFIFKIKLFYYLIDKGFVRRTIIKNKPDVVHIHGLTSGTISYLEVCEEMKIPYIVTLHGLVRNSPNALNVDRLIEQNYLAFFDKNHVPVSVVSSGIKRKLISNSYYGVLNKDNITVIHNGVDKISNIDYIDIRNTYNLPKKSKIILAVGSVFEGKNQKQIVRAYEKLSDSIKDNVWIFLIGVIDESYKIVDEIEKYKNADHFILTGFISRERLASFYSDADLVVLASLEEGFGLSIVEGFLYGVPCVTFSDLDVVSDVYDNNAMILCYERTDDALSASIASALFRKWDRELIKKYGMNFSLESMTYDYIKLYKNRLAIED